MKREIKFRGYIHDLSGLTSEEKEAIIEYNKIASISSLDIDSEECYLKVDALIPSFYGEAQYYNPCISLKNIHLMQYTGFKDKNGIEIYEGDVVRYTRYDSVLDKCSELYTTWEVVFKYYHFCLINKSPVIRGFSDFGDNQTIELEVVGNIYENPELLNEA